MKSILAVAIVFGLGAAASVGFAQDWEQYRDQVQVKKAIADSLTPEQYEAHVEKMARFLAAKAGEPAPAEAPGIRTPGDTCPAATHEITTLPFNTSGTTVGLVDDYDLPPDTSNPTCTAPVTCTGQGPAGSLPRGAIYTGTGTAPDIAYRIQTDANCTLSIGMTAPTQDLSLLLYLAQCSSSLADCACASDTALAGGTETIQLSAVAGTEYFVVIDGYSTGAVPPGPSGPYSLSITGAGCNLVPVELQNFSID